MMLMMIFALIERKPQLLCAVEYYGLDLSGFIGNFYNVFHGVAHLRKPRGRLS